MNDVSVVTIVRNRPRHLQRLIEGLAASDEPPRELIVVDMSNNPVVMPDLRFPGRRIAFDTNGLALAAARNLGAKSARGERLLFLDVDCIPRHNLIAEIDRILTERDALICGEVRYLGPDGNVLEAEDDLYEASIPHHARSFPARGYRIEPNPGLFWSLTFGIRRARFASLGGFDEGFVGYGAEDTDFGFRAREAGLPLLFLGGTGAFHQYHGVISPPLHHLDDILSNAKRFHARWGFWPMQDWLWQFAELGLIAFHGNELNFLRRPTFDEVTKATQPETSVY